jgi:2-oxoglutarate/2-oxoacid ferredoxin oxidoreductase subunit alpha
VLGSYRTILVPELNTGQLLTLIRARYLAPAVGYSKMQGLPFRVGELEQEIERRL